LQSHAKNLQVYLFNRDLSHKFNKMIQIQTKEWFDRVNGNTYFSSDVFLGVDKIMSLPFQYGYNGARDAVERKLAKHFGISAERWELRDMLRQNGIEIGETRVKALKRELAKESFEDFTPFDKPENRQKYALHRMQNGIPLAHSVMENVFVESVSIDGCTVKLTGGKATIAFSHFDWF
jgi:hypothetical protein